MVTVELNGKKYQCPTCYEELKTRHWIWIVTKWDTDKDIADRDFFRLFCVLVDAPFTRFQDSAELRVTIWNCIKWIIEQSFKFLKHIPKALDIPGGSVLIPDNPSELSIGQNIHLRQVISKASCLEECISIATAIFLQPKHTGTAFSMSEVRKLEEKLNEMPVYLIYPIGFFLLKRAIKTGKHSVIEWSRIRRSLNSIQNKMLRGWRGFKGLFHSTT